MILQIISHNHDLGCTGKYGRKKFKRVCIKRCKVIRKHFKRYYDEVAQLMDDAISQDDDMDEVSDQDVGEVEDQDDSEQDLAVMQSPMPYGIYPSLHNIHRVIPNKAIEILICIGILSSSPACSQQDCIIYLNIISDDTTNDIIITEPCMCMYKSCRSGLCSHLTYFHFY